MTPCPVVQWIQRSSAPFEAVFVSRSNLLEFHIRERRSPSAPQAARRLTRVFQLLPPSCAARRQCSAAMANGKGPAVEESDDDVEDLGAEAFEASDDGDEGEYRAASVDTEDDEEDEVRWKRWSWCRPLATKDLCGQGRHGAFRAVSLSLYPDPICDPRTAPSTANACAPECRGARRRVMRLVRERARRRGSERTGPPPPPVLFPSVHLTPTFRLSSRKQKKLEKIFAIA
jgi:hypothetical protein